MQSERKKDSIINLQDKLGIKESLPNSQQLIAYLNLYVKNILESENKKTFTKFFNSAQRFTNVLNLTHLPASDIIEEIIIEVKGLLTTASSFNDWFNLIFTLRKYAEIAQLLKTFKGDSRSSLTLHALATLIQNHLKKYCPDEYENTVKKYYDLENQYQTEINQLLEKNQDANEINKKLIEIHYKLAMLGNPEDVNIANIENIFQYYNLIIFSNSEDVNITNIKSLKNFKHLFEQPTTNYEKYTFLNIDKIKETIEEWPSLKQPIQYGIPLCLQDDFPELLYQHRFQSIIDNDFQKFKENAKSNQESPFANFLIQFLDLYKELTSEERQSTTTKIISTFQQSLYNVGFSSHGSVSDEIDNMMEKAKNSIKKIQHFEDWFQLILSLREFAEQAQDCKTYKNDPSRSSLTFHAAATLIQQYLLEEHNNEYKKALNKLYEDEKIIKNEINRISQNCRGINLDTQITKLREIHYTLAMLKEIKYINLVRIEGQFYKKNNKNKYLEIYNLPNSKDLVKYKCLENGLFNIPLCLQNDFPKWYYNYFFQKYNKKKSFENFWTEAKEINSIAHKDDKINSNDFKENENHDNGEVIKEHSISKQNESNDKSFNETNINSSQSSFFNNKKNKNLKKDDNVPKKKSTLNK